MRIPASTYRLQLSPEFTLRDARDLLPYLEALGVTDVYLSPILAPRPGSDHGYDVADATRLNPALGTDEDLERLARDLRERDMGLLLDIVPNHMAACGANPWWRDVLRWGRGSRHAHWFDIDWEPGWPGTSGRVMVPLLGDHYGAILDRGELRLAWEAGEFVVRYWEHAWPLTPPSCAALVREGLDDLNAPAEVVRELEDVADALEASSPEAQHPADDALETLATLLDAHPGVADHLEETLSRVQGDAARMDALLERQYWRLAYWKMGPHEINYRRFFNVADLVGVRVEVPEVRAATHARVLQMVEEGAVTGLRIDHIDGLHDPRGYLDWLADRVRRLSGEEEPYLLVEKILSGNEDLPGEWPVAGTTGYDFLNVVNGVSLAPLGLEALDDVYARFTGITAPFEAIVREGQRFVIRSLFDGDATRLATRLTALARRDRAARDVAFAELRAVLVEVSAALPVYRTYICQADPAAVNERDRAYVEGAVASGRRSTPSLDPAAWDFLRRVLLLDVDEALRPDALEFVQAWQQFTPPVMAKGIEDTSLYVYNRLISLNTVGGEPDHPEISLREFHRINAERRERWPGAMSASATHDAKRGEDVRARLNVLSELPEEWEAHIRRWAKWNDRHARQASGHRVPHPNEEIHIYQTLVGAWPTEEHEARDFRPRLRDYLIKSAREAKLFTSWHDTDPAHEEALLAFTDAILEPGSDNRFLQDMLELQERIAWYGHMNGLAALVLQMASPGVPDLYQGSELWNLNLVDPDNRRPVDYERRARVLAELEEEPSAEEVTRLLRNWHDGHVKLLVTARALRMRRARRDLFLCGSYEPLRAERPFRTHVCAFARRHEGDWLLAAVPRHVTRLCEPGRPPLGEGTWRDTLLPLPADAPTEWRDLLTGETRTAVLEEAHPSLPLAEVFGTAPVALLEPVE
ncbi:MAG: malto-oligosyltrehalose synthase [Myxococcota bacterium]